MGTGALGVLLMIVLRAIERSKRADLRHDLVRLLLLGAQHRRTSSLFLGGRLRENRAAILIAEVRALAVQGVGSWISKKISSSRL